MDREHATLFRLFAAVDYRDPEAIRTFARAFGLLGLAAADGGEPHLAWAREICLMQEALELVQPPGDAAEAQERQRKLIALVDARLTGVHGRLTLEPDEAPALTLAPGNLLAAMWLQLALAIAADKKFVACKQCGRMLELSKGPTGFRSHREFCSVACKTKDYRKRKRLARQMAAAGSPLTDVANAAGTDVATVRSWIAGRSRP